MRVLITALVFCFITTTTNQSMAAQQSPHCLRMTGGGFIPNPICYKTKNDCNNVKRNLVSIWRKRGVKVSGTCTPM